MKKNPDYSESAINLRNPPDMLPYLNNLHSFYTSLDNILLEIENLIPTELKEKQEQLETDIRDTIKNIKTLIEEQGSYQNIEKGLYALKRSKKNTVYLPELVRQHTSAQIASSVIIESVDVKVMKEIIKTGQLNKETAKRCQEIKESFIYTIK